MDEAVSDTLTTLAAVRALLGEPANSGAWPAVLRQRILAEVEGFVRCLEQEGTGAETGTGERGSEEGSCCDDEKRTVLEGKGEGGVSASSAAPIGSRGRGRPRGRPRGRGRGRGR